MCNTSMSRSGAAAAVVLVALLASAGGGASADDRPASDFFSVDGVRIHYLVQGSGTPVLLVHGWYSSAELNWAAPGIVAALARNHRVIAPDLPEYGRSDKPAGAAAYGEQWIEDMARLLDHLSVPKAHIIGYPMGGMVALKFTARHPDRAVSQLLGGMGYMREGGALQKTWAGMRDTASRSVSELALTPEQVKAVRTPTEIVVGGKDFVKKLYVDPLLAVRRDWPVVEIDGADHISCILKSQFRDELARWLDRQG